MSLMCRLLCCKLPACCCFALPASNTVFQHSDSFSSKAPIKRSMSLMRSRSRNLSFMSAPATTIFHLPEKALTNVFEFANVGTDASFPLVCSFFAVAVDLSIHTLSLPCHLLLTRVRHPAQYKNLRNLTIRGVEPQQSADLIHFLNQCNFGQLKSFAISGAFNGPLVLEALAKADQLEHLAFCEGDWTYTTYLSVECDASALTRVQSLVLESCSVHHLALVATLPRCKQLKSLTLWDISTLKNGEVDACRCLISAIGSFSELHTLKIGHMRLAPELWHPLFNALEKCSSIETLDMTAFHLREAPRGSLAGLLRKFTHLKQLHLTANGLGANDCDVLRVMQNFTSLEELYIGENKLSDTTAFAELTDSLFLLHELRSLNISKNDFTPQQASVLASLVARLPLKQLFMQDFGQMDTISGAQWGDAIQAISPTLETLDISDNKALMDDVIGALEYCTNLRVLHLRAALGPGYRASLLAQYLGNLTNLRVLDLSNNGLETADFEGIAVGLEHLVHLRSLNLSYNNIALLSCYRVAELLKESLPNLEQLSLTGNPDITSHDALLLSRFARRRSVKTARNLDLYIKANRERFPPLSKTVKTVIVPRHSTDSMAGGSQDMKYSHDACADLCTIQ
eukprot:GILJ01018120.1.p1 GENE.GILJ01018120.1~~GILJ01018120.1.p1  ORF type:complete len:627 (-),score=72.98 GILJ01018120.1:81-1961(-)